MRLAFRETKTFTRKLFKIWDEGLYFELQDELLVYPDLGVLIPGGEGIRKIRAQARGRGKRGGVRVIYYWQVSKDIILLLDIFAKNEKSDLTKDELVDLLKTVKEAFNE